MSERERQEPTAAERGVQDAVRSLARPKPDPAFRARLRQDFVTGRFGRLSLVPRPWALRPLVWIPAAVTFVAVALAVANRGPDWRVVAVSGEGTVVVNGTSIAATDARAIAARLSRGGKLDVNGAVTLDLVAPGLLAVSLAPGSVATLPAPPNRWWARAMEVSLAGGNGYFSTGRDFHGARLDVVTPDAVVRAVGTSFAVLSLPRATCVCVMEGSVNVGAHGTRAGEGVAVPHGMRRVVDRQGGAETLPILEDSVHHLHEQISRGVGLLRR